MYAFSTIFKNCLKQIGKFRERGFILISQIIQYNLRLFVENYYIHF